MNITIDEINSLATLHGNTREAREVRSKLSAEGLRFCPSCCTVRSVTNFGTNGPGRLAGNCRPCTARRRGPRIRYNRVGGKARSALNSRLSRAPRKDEINARERVARAANPEPGREASRRRRADKGNLVRAELRRNYHDRRSLGMTAAQAAYDAPWDEFEDDWREFLKDNRTREPMFTVKDKRPAMARSQELYNARHMEKIDERQQRESA